MSLTPDDYDILAQALLHYTRHLLDNNRMAEYRPARILYEEEILPNTTDTSLPETLLREPQDRLEEARRLTARFPGINVVEVPMSTVDPADIRGFMTPQED